jgi:hypothetical protein
MLGKKRGIIHRGLWSLLCLVAVLGFTTAQADDDAWKRIDKKGIRTGTVSFGINNLVAITCPAALPTAQPRLLLHVQAIQTDYDERSRYNLRIVINDYRADFGMSAQDGTLYFEAKDFNQRDMFETFVHQLMAAAKGGTDHAQLAVSSLGWRGDMPLAGADQVLVGLMDGCGE